MFLISLLTLEISTGINSIVKTAITRRKRVIFKLLSHPSHTGHAFTNCPHYIKVFNGCSFMQVMVFGQLSNNNSFFHVKKR